MAIENYNNVIDTIRRSNAGAFKDSGKVILNQLYPEDFEYYLYAFEVVDSKTKRVLDRFVFPVNPSKVSIQNKKITNIKRTNAGIISLSDNSFIPSIISINGNFGRKLKLNIGNFEDTSKNNFNLFSEYAKTGYGFVKTLERIYEKSTELSGDSGQGEYPFDLFFYNLSFNQAYLVEMLDFGADMDENASNMIWNYRIVLKTLAPLNSIIDYETIKSNNFGSGFASIINKTANRLALTIGRTLT